MRRRLYSAAGVRTVGVASAVGYYGAKPGIVLRVLPGGGGGSLEGSGILQGSWGEPITFTRSGSWTGTRSDGSVFTVGTNVPAVEAGGFKARAAVTNLALRSEEFENATWQVLSPGVGTIATNAVVAPSGAQTAETFTESETSAPQGRFQSVAFSAGAHTLSLYAKAGTQRYLTISMSNTGTFGAKFDLQTGTHIASGASVTSAGIRASVDGWYRLSVTATMTAATHFPEFWTEQDGTSTITRTTQGAGKTVHVWGAMLTATGHAPDYSGPTAGTAVTCNADVASVSTAGWPAAAGEVRLRFVPDWSSAALTIPLVRTNYTAPVTGIYLAVLSGGAIQLQLSDAGESTNTASSALGWAAGQAYHIRARWGGGNAYVWRDDVLVASTTNGTAKVPTSHGGASGAALGHSTTAQMANGAISDFEVRR